MSSAVYYRFQSQKAPSRVQFDGTGISVFDLKREILIQNHLDSTADSFELKVSNPDTHDAYDDDGEVVPRSTSVVARRIPVVRQGGRNAAARYISGNPLVNAKNAARRENFKAVAAPQKPAESAPLPLPIGGQATEEDQLNAVFQAQVEQWQQTQQEMGTKTPVYMPRSAPAGASKDPGPNYVCHRCGKKGHYIQFCPTLNDANWENKRVRRTTGIPKSMLRTIEKPAEDEGGTYMIDADGNYVVAVADDRSWQDFQARQMQHAAKAKREVPKELQDPLTHELMVDPMKMPCCGTVYSDSSIQRALINSEFVCPSCKTEDVYIDQLEPDDEMESKLYNFNHNGEEDVDRKRDLSDEEDVEKPEAKRLKDAPASPEQLSEPPANESPVEVEAAPKPVMPMLPFMLPFFMLGMQNRPLRSYDLPEQDSDTDSSDGDDDRRTRRGRV